MSIGPTPEQDAFLGEVTLDELRHAIRQGLAALDCGAFTEVGDQDLDTCLDALAASDGP